MHNLLIVVRVSRSIKFSPRALDAIHDSLAQDAVKRVDCDTETLIEKSEPLFIV